MSNESLPRDMLPWGIRHIANFFSYRKILKRYENEPKKLVQLKRDMVLMGFNDAIENFLDTELMMDLTNNLMLREELKLRDAQKKVDDRVLKYSSGNSEQNEMNHVQRRKEREHPIRGQYDPSFKPTHEIMKKYVPKYTKYPYKYMIREDYDIPEKDIWVTILKVEGFGICDVLYSRSCLDLNSEVWKKAKEYADIFKLEENLNQSFHWDEKDAVEERMSRFNRIVEENARQQEIQSRLRNKTRKIRDMRDI